MFAVLAASLLIVWCYKPWRFSANMLVRGCLQLHSCLAPDICYHSMLWVFLHFHTTWSICTISLIICGKRPQPKQYLSLSSSTPQPVKLDRANCWCLCFSPVLLPLLSLLQVAMPSTQSKACLYLEQHRDSFWTQPEFRNSVSWRVLAVWAHAHHAFEVLRGFLPIFSIYYNGPVGAWVACWRMRQYGG